jgi:hypothetical protein
MMAAETHKGQGRAALLTLSLFSFTPILLFGGWLLFDNSLLSKV